MVDLLRFDVHLAHFLVAKISSRVAVGVFLRHIYVVALAAVIKQIIADLCEVVHTLPTRKVPINPRGADRPGGRCHASDISCCDHISNCAYHGLVNLDVAQARDVMARRLAR